MISCTVGICIYNEEKNIENLLRSLKNQKLQSIRINEIVIISSGSIDKSLKIVYKYQKKDKRIKIVTQKKREGKASAVNLLLTKAKNNIIVLTGGDIIFDKSTIELLVQPFHDQNIGMTGAHPVPIKEKGNYFSELGELLWEMHHQVALKTPKMGEVVAFRKVFFRIPQHTSVDEANIEPLIRGQGYAIRYISSAIIFNKAPQTISDFIKQRKRIFSGHTALKYEQGYEVSTYRIAHILPVIISTVQKQFFSRKLFFLMLLLVLEGTSRMIAWYEYFLFKKSYTIWEPIASTKKLRTRGAIR
jgi:cellulose synthase/poly-beta-1,6-N-acetylglucosamine synthase-like glycosyltransferase